MPRSDNDTWDLATGVGATATMVAAGRARATRAQLIDDRFAEPLVAAVGIDFFTRWATGALDAGEVDTPGVPWGMQAMILASGLDARGFRLPWLAGMTLFEIDQPQVIEFKQATSATLGAELTVDLRALSRFPAADLGCRRGPRRAAAASRAA